MKKSKKIKFLSLYVYLSPNCLKSIIVHVHYTHVICVHVTITEGGPLCPSQKVENFKVSKFFLNTHSQWFSQPKNTILMVFGASSLVKTRVLVIFRSQKSIFNVKMTIFLIFSIKTCTAIKNSVYFVFSTMNYL